MAEKVFDGWIEDQLNGIMQVEIYEEFNGDESYQTFYVDGELADDVETLEGFEQTYGSKFSLTLADAKADRYVDIRDFV